MVARWLGRYRRSVLQYFTLLIVTCRSCYFKERVVVTIRGCRENSD
jgi:hypothetical protein